MHDHPLHSVTFRLPNHADPDQNIVPQPGVPASMIVSLPGNVHVGMDAEVIDVWPDPNNDGYVLVLVKENETDTPEAPHVAT